MVLELKSIAEDLSRGEEGLVLVFGGESSSFSAAAVDKEDAAAAGTELQLLKQIVEGQERLSKLRHCFVVDVNSSSSSSNSNNSSSPSTTTRSITPIVNDNSMANKKGGFHYVEEADADLL